MLKFDAGAKRTVKAVILPLGPDYFAGNKHRLLVIPGLKPQFHLSVRRYSLIREYADAPGADVAAIAPIQ